MERECIAAFLSQRYCNGVMGVPIDYCYPLSIKSCAAGTMNDLIDGKETYRRILIRKKVSA